MSEIGLTVSEVSEVKRTWDIVKQNKEDHGVAVLVKLFTENPTYQSKFVNFKTVKVEDLPDNTEFKSHALQFMDAVTSLIDNLENKEELLRLIMENALNLLHRYLKNALGNELNADGASGWKKTLDVLLQVIKADLKELDSQQ